MLKCLLSRRPVTLKAGASTCKRWVSSHARQCWVGSMFTCCAHFVSLHRAQLIDIDYIVFNFEDPVDRGSRLSVHSNAFSDCKLLRTGSWHRVANRCHSLITRALRCDRFAVVSQDATQMDCLVSFKRMSNRSKFDGYDICSYFKG